MDSLNRPKTINFAATLVCKCRHDLSGIEPGMQYDYNASKLHYGMTTMSVNYKIVTTLKSVTYGITNLDGNVSKIRLDWNVAKLP